MEWSLYGYERNTTPRMEGLDGLIHFTDVVTQSNNTHKSVPIILSAASAENYGVIYDEKSIVTAFKEAGFRTLVIANQKLTTSMIGAFYREADTFIDMSTFNTGSYLTSLYDAALLPYLEKELDKSDEDMFIVLHTYGSHFNYHERYPAEFRIYTPDKAEGIRGGKVHGRLLDALPERSVLLAVGGQRPVQFVFGDLPGRTLGVLTVRFERPEHQRAGNDVIGTVAS